MMKSKRLLQGRGKVLFFRKICAAFLCLLVLLLLPACMGDGASDGKLPATHAPASKPVTEISCIMPESLPAILPAKDGKFLACWSDYEASVTHLRLVDTAKDEVTAVSGGDFLVTMDEGTRFYRLSDRTECCSLEENGIEGQFRYATWLR